MTVLLHRLWLTARVHFDGFRSAPAAYLVAVWWWLCRKRVRAKGQFAPLLARSSHAYTLFALRDLEAHRLPADVNALPPLIALVAVNNGLVPTSKALAATLQNLANEGVHAHVLEADHIDSLAGISIDWTGSPWTMVLEAGDLLAPGAAQAYRAAMDDAVSVIYADDDRIDQRGQLRDPHFKPAWNSELFDHFDYLNGACIMRAMRDDLAAVAGQPDWQHRLLRLALARGEVRHVDTVLHHRAARPAPPAQPASFVIAKDLPTVSVIVPTRNRLDLLRTCLDGLSGTDYPAIEVIVVDNDSDDPEMLAYLAALEPEKVRVLRHTGPFNYSAINNRAVSEASGQLLCLLNNDIEMIGADWLKVMATQALRPDVGAVGAQLLYPDGRIQHAGVVIGVGNAAGHAHRFIRPDHEGYFRRHTLPQFASAVTAACLVVARDRFLAVGGLDEVNFAVAYNDVDLCLRLNQRGWQSLYEPRARLVHHESVSRGFDRDPVGAKRFAGELAALQRIWHTDQIVDPYHHPRLSRASEQFALAL